MIINQQTFSIIPSTLSLSVCASLINIFSSSLSFRVDRERRDEHHVKLVALHQTYSHTLPFPPPPQKNETVFFGLSVCLLVSWNLEGWTLSLVASTRLGTPAILRPIESF